MNVDGTLPGKPRLPLRTVQASGSTRQRQPIPGPLAPLHVGALSFPGQLSLAELDRLSFLMDRLFKIPGTRLRVGLNTILLLLPVLGDIIPSLVGIVILMVGLKHYRVPRIVAARMVLNTCLDAALGWIPILGDLFDLFYKADTRNVRLLQAYAESADGKPRSTWVHWVFVIGVLVLFVLVCVFLVFGTLALVRWMNQSVNHMFGVP